MSVQILLPLQTYPDGNSETLLHHAAVIAAHLQGELHALVMAADFPRVSSALGNLVLDVPSLMAGAQEACRHKGASLLNALKDHAKTNGVAIRSDEIQCFPSVFGDEVAKSARYHDLVLMGLTGSDTLMQSAAEAVVFGSGRPVVLLPEDKEIGSLDHVLIAWDGSRVAARAVNDARHFLKRAVKVTVAVVTDEKALPDSELGQKLVAYLAAQGVRAEELNIRSNGQSVADTLQDEAARIGTGLLVMGGFGHSRMRDFVLGGATLGILRNLRMPVLLSH